MKSLRSPAFKFTDDQLCRAYRELYSDQMVIVTNLKPSIGEAEMKLDKRMRGIQYFKIALNTTSNDDSKAHPDNSSQGTVRLGSMNDIFVSF